MSETFSPVVFVHESRLGAYLRARRELLRPDDVGLQAGLGRRRVTGLRREEVALLAGISAEYYLRLEQGRDHHPSEQVLRALGRALMLDEAGARHLKELAAPPTIRPQAHIGDDAVHPQTQWLIESWQTVPAVVHSRFLDVLGSNELARALNPNFRPGVNGLVSLLLEPHDRALFRDWEGLTARLIALFRTLNGMSSGEPRFEELLAELFSRSERFRTLWPRNDVITLADGTHILDHPEVGEMVLHFARLPLPATNGQSIFLYHAEPDSPSADALARLSASHS
jgi:transcriptional regulator with XRE-family HTH domain